MTYFKALALATLCVTAGSAAVAADNDRSKGGIRLAQIDPGIWYGIVAESSHKALQVAGPGNGAALEQASATGADTQLFRFRQVASGYFEIVAKINGKVMEVRDGAVRDETPIQLNTATGADRQQFAMVQDTNGSWTIVAKVSGYGFDILGGAKTIADHIAVVTYPTNNAPNHKYRLVPAMPGAR